MATMMYKDGLTLRDILEFINKALDLEYGSVDIEASNPKIVSKYFRQELVEMTVRAEVNGRKTIFDIKYDKDWVGINWTGYLAPRD